MKFLLDQDVPEDLAYLLRELNHEVLRLRDVLPLEATDAAVLACAAEHDCFLTTCNRDDFLELGETQRLKRATPRRRRSSSRCRNFYLASRSATLNVIFATTAPRVVACSATTT